MSLKDEISFDNVPSHVAVIMDGNGRWAKQKGKLRVFGHTNGVKSVREVLMAATDVGVKYLTIYAFSTENWKRPKFEVNALMDLLVNTIFGEIDELDKNGVCLNAIGEIEDLPKKCKKTLQNAIERTKNNSKITLTIAVNYSARWEILKATKEIANDVANGNLNSDKINDELFSSYLTTNNIPDPELLIRTSGEHRISNYLLWQIAYSELYFTDTLWPDFGKENFFQAILDYQNRERRFGKTSEQIKKSSYA